MALGCRVSVSFWIYGLKGLGSGFGDFAVWDSLVLLVALSSGFRANHFFRSLVINQGPE